ncbi:MAG: hypothetical protein JWL84_3607 [Rhodospirillales bacterium]|nr:hypothetical protein [Rhodospirillales bacterium]
MRSQIWHSSRSVPAPSRAAAPLLTGIVVASAIFIATAAQVTYAADNPTEQGSAGSETNTVQVQPPESEFKSPNPPDVDSSAAKEVDELYRQLTGHDPNSPVAPPPSTRSATDSAAEMH